MFLDKFYKIFLILILSTFQIVYADDEKNLFKKKEIVGSKNFLHEYESINQNGSINVVVEISVGENEKWEVSKKDGILKWEFTNNSYRTIKYLPYPVNYGFIPQTILSKNIGGDGDPIDVLLLGEKFKKGSVVEAKILGLMMMKDNGNDDHKIIAIPYKGKIFPEKNLNNLNDLKKNYPGVLIILETWFKNYKRSGLIEIIGYEDKQASFKLIEKAKKPYELLKGYWLNKSQ